MNNTAQQLLKFWQKRNISGFYYQKIEEAARKILEIVPPDASIGFSGSQTLSQMNLIGLLEERGNIVFNPYKSGLSVDESLEIRRLATSADFYLASANSITEDGKLIFFSGFGNRTSGIAYAKNVLVICGVNKIVKDLAGALKRAREYATPLNCKRLNWNTPCLKDGTCHEDTCFFPEYKRMCCQVLIIEGEVSPDRLKVILIGESLGF